MFGYFYPENNQRFLESMSFDSAEEAIAWLLDKHPAWQTIKATGHDKAAILDPLTGTIVVIRELSQKEPS